MNIAVLANKALRPFSMYKGMSLGLTAIWAVALMLSFFGVLYFSPVALIASTVVLATSTFLASLACGKLFGVPSHLESSYITGLILVLIFTPIADVAGLVVLAFIGLIAGASKYVVILSGRHVFNPAAFAAVVVSLTGLSAASWWVATPVLTPIVLAVVIVSLYQTKRFAVAGVFLAIAVPIIMLQLYLFGTPFLEAAWLLLSWPLLFFAGIMLVEPLTLPPRKWQMYIVAAVTGLLFAIPIKMGAFEMTPALALIAGNIVAVIFARRQAIRLTFKGRTSLTPLSDEYTFTTSKPVYFVPGQYMEISLPHTKKDTRGIRRSFSITSLPGSKQISFGIKFYEPSSTFKKALKAIKAGTVINATNVAGDFVLPNVSKQPLLFIAGGIGITPFIGHLRWLRSKNESRDIVLLYAVGAPQDIAYQDELEALGVKTVIISEHEPTGLPKAWHYVPSGLLTKDLLASTVEDIADRIVYVSGPTPFVQSVRRHAKSLKALKVVSDYFSGY